MSATAEQFLNEATEMGYQVSTNGNVVKIWKCFTPGDKKAFNACDMEYGFLLDLIPCRGGSQWGTDGGTVGGIIAIERGLFMMNQSGVSKKWIKDLMRLIEAKAAA